MPSGPESYLLKEGHQRYQSINPVRNKSSRRQGLKKMNYDDILEELGELGTWQILNLLLLWLPSIASGIFVLTYSFTGDFDAFQFSNIKLIFRKVTLFNNLALKIRDDSGPKKSGIGSRWGPDPGEKYPTVMGPS